MLSWPLSSYALVFGYAVVGATTQGSGAENCTKFTTPSTGGSITALGEYTLQNGAGAGTNIMAIYSDLAGAPSTRLASETTGFAIDATGAWGTSTISYIFTPSQIMWLCGFNSNGQAFKYDVGAAAQNKDSSGQTYPTWQNPFGTVSNSLARMMSIYATYTTSTGLITLIQQKSVTDTNVNTTIVGTMDSTPTQSNVLTLEARANSGLSISSITQTGVTWTSVTSSNGGRLSTIWYGLVGSGPSSSITVNLSGTKNPSGQFCVQEWSGIDTTSAAAATDIASSTADGIGTTITAGPITTSNASDVIIVSSSLATGSATTSTMTNGFGYLNYAGNNALYCGYRIVNTAGSYSTSWTMTSSAVLSNVSIAAFKAASAVVSATIPHFIFRSGTLTSGILNN